jgi:hypothetical protein
MSNNNNNFYNLEKKYKKKESKELFSLASDLLNETTYSFFEVTPNFEAMEGHQWSVYGKLGELETIVEILKDRIKPVSLNENNLLDGGAKKRKRRTMKRK